MLNRRAEIIRERAERAAAVAIDGPNGPPIERRRGGNAGKAGHAPASVRDLAKRTGRSEGDIKRSQKRVEAVGVQTLKRIIRTSLDKPKEVEALAKMPEPEREVIIAKAEAEAAKPEPEREKVSAVEVIKAKAIQRRAEIIEAMEAEKREAEAKAVSDGANAPPPKKNPKGGGRAGIAGPAPSGSRNIASVQGVSKETVRKARKRVQALGTETLERVVGMQLNAISHSAVYSFSQIHYKLR